ncbi:hypothetical protein EVJ58_g6615 [Rhodofomes roseus]|uniref:Uncharacterized protein n=1 Tax=Rhodofomes roseus TaxID=34475 RepID=A0A4Y9Y7S1_9APHY|nr:hypothetical protein EVJ58_g6615 [Rhodofomes roseus]
MFTPSSVFALTPVAAKKDKAWGKADESESDEDESDDDEDDDEDEGEAGKKSHIPQDRRAGAGVQKKKMSGLASFAK